MYTHVNLSLMEEATKGQQFLSTKCEDSRRGGEDEPFTCVRGETINTNRMRLTRPCAADAGIPTILRLVRLVGVPITALLLARRANGRPFTRSNVRKKKFVSRPGKRKNAPTSPTPTALLMEVSTF